MQHVPLKSSLHEKKWTSSAKTLYSAYCRALVNMQESHQYLDLVNILDLDETYKCVDSSHS